MLDKRIEMNHKLFILQFGTRYLKMRASNDLPRIELLKQNMKNRRNCFMERGNHNQLKRMKENNKHWPDINKK